MAQLEQQEEIAGEAPDDSPFSRRTLRRDALFPVKRSAVLNAAASLFRKQGFDGASISDLAAILNVTKPTVYYYVKNKDALLLEIKMSAQADILRFMRETEVGPANAYEKLRAILIEYGLLMTSDIGACFGLIGNEKMNLESRAQVEKGIREGDDIIFRILRLGQKDRSLNISDPTITLFTLFGSLNSLPTWFRPNGRMSAKKLVTKQVDILLGGLKGELHEASAAPQKRAAKSRAREDVPGRKTAKRPSKNARAADADKSRASVLI